MRTPQAEVRLREEGHLESSGAVATLLRLAGVLVLVALNGFFVAAEFALVGSRRTRLEQLASAGNATAALGRRMQEDLDRYIAADHPLDCAGGFKAESLGIALFERIESEDPTGLTGLPLIWVAAALRRAGLSAP